MLPIYRSSPSVYYAYAYWRMIYESVGGKQLFSALVFLTYIYIYTFPSLLQNNVTLQYIDLAPLCNKNPRLFIIPYCTTFLIKATKLLHK